MEGKPMPGYNGRILRVNLTTGSVSAEPTDEAFCRKHLGGAGFVSHFLLKELKPGADPLGPGNKLVMAAGPLTGAPLSGTGRHCAGARSPLTGGFAKSESGGYWGAELKYAGYDAVIIEGRADRPVYLLINDGEANLREAGHLWGMNTRETQQAIRAELGDSLVRVATIGPAGENQVRFSCIINDLHSASGRGGLGAVMGSKNLKAVAVRGHQKPQIAHPERLKELSRWLLDNKRLWAGQHELGTGAGMLAGAVSGNLPVRNFAEGEFPEVSQISSETIRDTIRIRMESCHACMVRCKKVVSFAEPYPVDPAYGGPEYETLASLGSNCGISDLAAVCKGNELCNAYALDTISTGDTISFAMECFERGLLSKSDTGGLELRFGNAVAMLEVIGLIARRKGIGDLLAEGTARAALRIGRGATEFAMEVKGLEIPMHDPRVKAMLGLGYMVNPHGADHCASMHDTQYAAPGRAFNAISSLGIVDPLPAEQLGPRKVAMLRQVQLYRILGDCLLLCLFVPWTPEQAARILTAVTGYEMGIIELLRVAERTLTAARLFNLREGFTSADDRLPRRFFQPKKNGALSAKFYDAGQLEKDKSFYYSLMGWDPRTGVPLPEKVEELGI